MVGPLTRRERWPTDPDTVKLAFIKDTNTRVRVRDGYVALVARQFEKANPGKKVRLIPVQASENDYYTKIQQKIRKVSS
ncbi:hypothetical protein ABT168_04890 [Streptomyces sp. NPDC001793]|uniref:hypothetical protein n=1 Tax=Streptomyces sp. NPDC001793 TaxID=3154657 RepID=UPI00332ABB66